MSTNELPLIGSPPMPALVVIPIPSCCICAERCGNENETRRGARVRYRFFDRIEHRAVEMRRAALAGCDAAHDVRAVGDHFLRVERALVAGEALDDDPRLLVEQDAHAAP